MIVSKRPAGDSEALQFLGENSSGLFNRKEWFRVLEEGFKEPVVAYCLEKDGKIRLALPGVILNFRLVKMFYSNIPYGGFVGDLQLIPSSLALFEESLRKDGIHLIRIGGTSQGEFREWEGYRQDGAFTHLIDLEGTDEEKLWNGYKKRVRRDIRKAEKSGIIVHEAASPEEMDILYALYSETMSRNEAFNIWTTNLFQAIYRDLARQGVAKILLAKLKDEIIAGMILLFSPETVYYFFAASAQKYLSLCPNDLLVHRGICLTIREGRRYYDLMTSPKEDVALMNFKEKWGAQKYPFHIYEKSLTFIRPWLWKRAWGLMNTPFGARLIHWLRGRQLFERSMKGKASEKYFSFPN